MNPGIITIIKTVVEILILWAVFYRVLLFFEGTRAFQVLRGIIYLVLAFLFSQVFELHTLNWILTKIFGISIIAFLIIFQQELRQGLAKLGQQHLFSVSLGESEILALIEDISSAVVKLSHKKIGCLIAMETETKLTPYIESGVHIDSKATQTLIQTIFTPYSPLHDGGVIIRQGRIAAASCLFPSTENPQLNKLLGMRHRAALGMSEQTDAIVILSSEESGDISMAHGGRLSICANKEELSKKLKNLLLSTTKKK